ncbi:hypothetical protein RvY_16808 [Ramazzottius varieornatus]|uniref:G-protein coupled receptors family 1 profile domain-containing protein n=1 Tax=Ramazzottius varieornatus TaxID=947166 RepID=A0A1D1VZW0_RAMVA|nr:hypothetical protein RvY_16808 [Ramazzottius varieornatus]
MVNDSSSLFNATYQTSPSLIDDPNWTFTPSFTLFIQISATGTNGLTLLLFILTPSLLTPFTVYILNLFVSNFLVATLYYPIELIAELYPKWWMPNAVCTFYQWSNWVLCSSVFVSHSLIALNRLWAVTFPVTYRRYHKKLFAFIVIIVAWVCLHVMVLPGIVLDVLLYRPPVETNGCNINTNAPKEWLWFAQLVLMDGPVVLVLLIYPVICYKTVRRLRTRVLPAEENPTKATLHKHGEPRSPSGSKVTANNAALPTKAEGRKDCRRIGTTCCCRNAQCGGGRGSRGFLAVSLMTLSLLICYSPALFYFTLYIIFDIDVPGMFSKSMILYELGAVLDPVWFLLSLSELRTSFLRTYLPFL